MTSWNIKWRERIKLLETWATASKKKTWEAGKIQNQANMRNQNWNVINISFLENIKTQLITIDGKIFLYEMQAVAYWFS
jgi:hypothetical protein